MSVRRIWLVGALAASLVACEGTTFRCDPSPSWSRRPDAPTPRDAGASWSCGGDSCRVVEAALGDRHSCVSIGELADVVCFGANESGQSSPLVSEPETLPVSVAQRTDYPHYPGDSSLSVGSLTTCAAFEGSLVCWGAGAVLGGARSDPPRLIEIDQVRVAEHAALHAVVRRGSAPYSVLGAWDGVDPSAPAPLDQPRPVVESVLGVGGFTTWGHWTAPGASEPTLMSRQGIPAPGRFGGTGFLRTVDYGLPCSDCSFAVGALHTCVTERADVVGCQGRNDRGQLGRGTIAPQEPHSLRRVPLPRGARILDVCVGGHVDIRADDDAITIGSPRGGHSCVLTDDGVVSCWGANDRGQLGDGTTGDRSSPAPIAELPPARSIHCGGEHTCAIDEHRELWCWGDNSFGQLGAPSSVVALRSMPAIVSLDAVLVP